MTISSETRKAGPFNGNGVTTSFPFVFKTFTKSDVKVIFTDADEIETILVLDSDYTVTLNADQNANPGGSISYSMLGTGEKLTVLGAIEYTQETDVQNQGGFYPEVIENAFDKITMLIQQVKEIADRAVVVPASSSVTSENYLDTINTYKLEADASEASALASSELANKWAEEAEDVPVGAGKFSAKHWAAKAEASGGDKLPISGGVLTGNLGFNGAGLRLTGDFSNATAANQLMFQTSTVNGGTYISAIPNGTDTSSGFVAMNKSTPSGSSAARVTITNTDARFISEIIDTGTFLPMTFYTNGSEKVRIDLNGNVGIGGTADSVAGAKFLTVGNASESGIFQAKAGTQQIRMQADLTSGYMGTFSNVPTLLFSNSTEKLRIGTDGSVTVSTPAGLGYGTGAGGSVTQATSKSTAVTLNKPTGQITLNAAALAAGVEINFLVNNSLISANDIVILTGGSLASNYIVKVGNVGAGAFSIQVKNNTAGSLSEAVVINFATIKGASA